MHLSYAYVSYDYEQGDWLGGPWKSVVVIDAGSTGSRVHIYQYKVSGAGLATVKQPFSSLKVTPGLSDYADQPQNVGESLSPLLEYAYKLVSALYLDIHSTVHPHIHSLVMTIMLPHVACSYCSSGPCEKCMSFDRYHVLCEQACIHSQLARKLLVHNDTALQAATRSKAETCSADPRPPAHFHRGTPVCNSRLQDPQPKSCSRPH